MQVFSQLCVGRSYLGRGEKTGVGTVSCRLRFTPFLPFWYFFGIFCLRSEGGRRGGNVCLILTVLHFIAQGNCVPGVGSRGICLTIVH